MDHAQTATQYSEDQTKRRQEKAKKEKKEKATE
jgi:hypothetical protein